MLWLVILSTLLNNGLSLDNGLALTPPMGWLTWTRFGCTTDCKKYPDDCISEQLIKRTVDAMVSEGYLAAGYEYVAIDDCWLERERGPDNRMLPDRQRFPSGMKALADYIHKNGMKFGMYQDYGNKTCMGYPGMYGYEELDIQTFYEWDIDYLKLDGCYMDPTKMDAGYPYVGQLLNRTGRPILYTCSWPAYQEDNKNITVNYTAIAQHCNLWRNFGDIDYSWSSLTDIMQWFGDNQQRLISHAKPGAWNDPDMLTIGNYGLSVDQSRVQMAVWAVLAAPLLMSVDLALMRPEYKEILLNRDVIAINQDKLGRQGRRVSIDKNLQVWVRDLADQSFAVAIVNLKPFGQPRLIDVTKVLVEMKLKTGQEYSVKELFKQSPDRAYVNNNDKFEVRVNPTGVQFLKFTPTKALETEEPKCEQENIVFSENLI